MSLASRVASFLRNLFFSARVERELDDELRGYVEMAVDEKRISQGLADDAARRAVLLEVGGVDQVKESVRDVHAGVLVDQLRQDLSYAIRMLRKNAGFTAAAVTTLALGIGANTAIFSVVDTVVFRPLPYKDPDRLVKICGKALPRNMRLTAVDANCSDDVSLPNFLDIRDQNHVFEQMAADDGVGGSITYADGSRERGINVALVTLEWLSTLGVQPILGRGFLADEDRHGHDRVVILTHAYWKRRFGSDPHVVGQTLAIDRDPFTVVGVLPPNVLRYGADLIRPLVPADYPPGRGYRDLDVFARLKPGVTLAQAQAEIDTIARRLEEQYRATNANSSYSLAQLGRYYAPIQRKAHQGLLLILGAVGVVLLIACANVANLLLARSLARYRECVIRAALGAGRARLIRQMLVESVLLFLMGGLSGILLARWSIDSLRALAVAGDYVPERIVVAVDGRVFAFTVIVSIIAGVVAGLVPALQASRVDPNDGLKASTQASSGGVSRNRANRLLIVSELALSIVLLVGFGLLIRSFMRVQAASGGFNAERLLVTDSDGGRSFASAVMFWRSAVEQARAVPGVEFAAVSSRPPVHGARRQPFMIAGHPIVTDEDARAGDILIGPDYFRAMGIPLLKGRAFTENDDGAAPLVVIISQSLARRHFANEDPIGRLLKVKEQTPMMCCTTAGGPSEVWREIVGVVGDVRQANLDEPPAVTLYRPYSQMVEHDMYLLVRTRSSSDATRVEANLRSALVAADPSREWSDVRPMHQVIDRSESIRLRRFVLTLLGSFAALALVLAAVGTYGVMAYAVADRTREIGIRVALGASRSVILRQVLGETTKLAMAGLVLGGLAAQAMTRFISTMLFDVSSADVVTYAGVSLLLASVALLASYIPARRAAQIDPMVALRHE